MKSPISPISVYPGYFHLTSLFVEQRGLVLEGNAGIGTQLTLGGAAFMSPDQKASGTHWKLIALPNGYYHLTTRFMEAKGLVLEGNGGLGSNMALSGAAFMSTDRAASGTMWRILPLANGAYLLTTLFLESQGRVLEGNGGIAQNHTLGGAAFMSPDKNASGVMWKFYAVD